MRVLVSTLACILGSAIGVVAQSPADDAQAHLAAAAAEEKASIMAEIFANNANSFVYILQSELRGRGFRLNEPTGQFTMDTIRELNAFCVEAYIIEISMRSPLAPDSVVAIAEALYASETVALAEVSPPDFAPPSSENSGAMTSDYTDFSEASKADSTISQRIVAGADPHASVAFGPISLDADSARWIWSGIELAGTPTAAITSVDMRRAGVYDPTGDKWLLGPTDYYASEDGSASVQFKSPAEGGARRSALGLYSGGGFRRRRRLHSSMENRCGWRLTLPPAPIR